MSRLEILKASLAKKEAIVDAKIGNHFETVASANGQPLNDKRNGASTMRQWERQNDSIRAAVAGVELTKAAIEREENKIINASCFEIPCWLAPFLEAGTITQWRKFPNRFFVKGVTKARIVIHDDHKIDHAHYTLSVPENERAIFKAVVLEVRAARDLANSKINAQNGVLK